MDKWIPDTAVAGLYVHTRSSGRKTYAFRAGGRETRQHIAIGVCNEMSLEEARTKARELNRSIETTRHRPSAAATFETIAERWIAEYAKVRLRSWKGLQHQIGRQYCGKLYDMPIGTITRRHIRNVVAPFVADTPAMANAIQRTISAMMTWAVHQEIIETNPCGDLDMPAPVTSRDRVLTTEELRAFWRATLRLSFPAGPIFRVLALTGQRRNEVAGMRWDELDLENALWTMPPARTKNARVHDVPLSTSVMEIIREAPRDGPRVFAGKSQVLSVVNRHLYPGKTFLDGAMPSDTPHWTPHDLRRTFSTWCAKEGYAQHVVEKLLNHKPKHISSIAAIYNRYEYLDERRVVLDDWADYLGSMDNVVRLRQEV